MEKTFKDRILEGLTALLEYVKKNILSFVLILLTILLFIFLVLPAATVTVSNISYASQQVTYVQETLTDYVASYRLSDILFGRIIQGTTGTFTENNLVTAAITNGVVKTFSAVFFPNNVFVGTGLILFIVAAVLMMIPKLAIRTIGAAFSLIGAILMIFIYFHVMYELPIVPTFVSVEYAVDFLAGPIVLIIVGAAIAGVAIFITVRDYLAAYRHGQSERQRYLRGGA